MTGGRLTVTFEVEELPLWWISFAEHLPPAARQEWQAVATAVFDRALGRRDTESAVDPELVDLRRAVLGTELDGLAAGYLDAFGWPWFVEQDLADWFDVIARHLATVEAAVSAEALARAEERPHPWRALLPRQRP